VLRLLRISLLLYLLAFVAVGSWVTSCETTDWDIPLRVHVYAVAGDTSDLARERADAMRAEDFDDIARFFAAEAQRYGVTLAEPFSFFVPATRAPALPALPSAGSWLGTARWSLEMRWLAMRLRWRAADPLVPDITLFVVLHDGSDGVTVDRSTALRKGLIAVANVYAAPSSRPQNDIVIAHELLHTLGATDKYAPTSNLPRYPEGFAEPDASPRYPQRRTELMAGRRPISPTTAEMPESLRNVMVGSRTAEEIGWHATTRQRAAMMTRSDE
jgi:hypothetical protein